ncbi:hypothetical protein X777_01762, partial [Ooceraea biroi]
VVQSQLASSPDAGVFLGDEALEGSGSGDSAVWRPRATEIDDDEDGHGGDGDDDDEASGSGMGPTTTGTMSCRPHTSALILRSDNPHNSTRYVTETKLYCRLLSTVSAIKYRYSY